MAFGMVGIARLVRHAAGSLVVVAAAASAMPVAAQEPPPAARGEPEMTPAEREWQLILDEMIPKLVRFRGLPDEEKRKETFRAELARIGEYVRKHQTTEPVAAATARVFMANQILAQALRREREAIEVLRDVAQKCEDVVLAGFAAVTAGDLLLRLGDETGLRALRELYGARPDKDPQFLARLDDQLRQIRLQPGRPFPDLPLADLAGRKIEPAQLRGRLTIVLVFNLDHEASREEFERLVALRKELADPGLGALAISVDKEVERVRKEAERLEVDFPIDCSGREWEGPAVKELGLTGIPATFLLDPDGTLLYSRNAVVGPELKALVEEHLGLLRAEGRLPPKPPQQK
jgi:peroxiredoxin